MGRYVKGFTLIENEKYQMAYQEFSRLIDHNNQDYTAYYYRGMIDFYYLKKNIPQTKNDFEIVIKKLPRYARYLYAPLAIISDIMDNPDQTIQYGMQAIQNKELYKQPELALEVNFAISRAYFQQAETKDDYQMAMDHLDKCFSYSEDETEELYLCKCDILMAMDSYEEVISLLDQFLMEFPLRPEVYFKRAQALTAIAKEKEEVSGEKDAKSLLEALTCYETYFKYRDDDPLAHFYQADVLRQLERYNEAIDIYESLRTVEWEDQPPHLEDELTLEIMKTYDNQGEISKAIAYVESYLNSHESWRLEYALALLISEENPNELANVLPLMHHAYEISSRPLVAMGIVETYRRLGQLKECYLWLESMIEKFPGEGRWYYYQADIAMKMNHPYQEAILLYKKAHTYGYIDDLEYCDMVIPLLKEPKGMFLKLKKLVKKATNKQLKEGLVSDDIEIGSVHKLSVRYLYGLHGLSVNPKRALQYARFCQSIFPNDCCLTINLGRSYEFLGKKAEAFKHYQKAQERVSKEEAPLCHCSYGYLAHSYLTGMGTTIDEEKASSLIQQAIQSEGEIADSSVLYLYAYLSLKGKEGFDIKKAVEYLEAPGSFQRYEITRYQLLLQLKEKLKQDTSNTHLRLKLAYRNDSKLAKKYYRNHRKDEIYYPFFNHY